MKAKSFCNELRLYFILNGTDNIMQLLHEIEDRGLWIEH